MASQILVGLDIGTSSIKTVIAERGRDGRPILRSIFKEPSQGMRRGVIVDLAEVSQAIARVVAEIKKFSRAAARNIYVSIGTPHVKTQNSRGISAVSRVDTEIYQDDIDRVIRASQAVTLGPNRMVLHNVTREFVVDGVGDISDPLGLSGSRLEVQSVIVDVFSPHVKHVIRATELAGGQVGGVVLSPLLGSRSVLSKHQKDLGTVSVDIGFGTTSMGVYEENKLVGVGIFPMGAGNITNDIAVGLKIPVAAAERLKLDRGYALAKEVNSREMIELKAFSEGAKGAVSRRFIAEIIESRLAEIFEFVNNELKLMGRAGQLPGGSVLTGGGAKLPGLTDLVRQELKLSSQIGSTLHDEWVVEDENFSGYFEDPEFVNALGLVLWGADQEKWRPRSAPASFTFRRLINYFLP